MMTLGTIELRRTPNWTLLRTPLAYKTLVDLAFINVGNAFQCFQRLLSVTSASEFNDAVTNNTRDQFDALSEQVHGLSKFVLPETEDMKFSFWD